MVYLRERVADGGGTYRIAFRNVRIGIESRRSRAGAGATCDCACMNLEASHQKKRATGERKGRYINEREGEVRVAGGRERGYQSSSEGLIRCGPTGLPGRDSACNAEVACWRRARSPRSLL